MSGLGIFFALLLAAGMVDGRRNKHNVHVVRLIVRDFLLLQNHGSRNIKKKTKKF